MLGIIACSKRPEMVVDEDKMVDVMVDIHKSEALVGLNPGKFTTDSVKKVYRQTIFKKHGITQEQFDSSLAWYGRHIDDFVKVYDRVLAEYEDQLNDANKRAEESGEIYEAMANDADNMWNLAPFQMIAWDSDRQNIGFELTDSNTINKGDRLRWQLRATNVTSRVDMLLGVDYTNGTTAYNTKIINQDGKYNLTLQTDSSFKVERVFGVVRCVPQRLEIVFIDSIVVDKLPLQPNTYNQIFGQRIFSFKKKKDVLERDSVSIRQDSLRRAAQIQNFRNNLSR